MYPRKGHSGLTIIDDLLHLWNAFLKDPSSECIFLKEGRTRHFFISRLKGCTQSQVSQLIYYLNLNFNHKLPNWLVFGVNKDEREEVGGGVGLCFSLPPRNNDPAVMRDCENVQVMLRPQPVTRLQQPSPCHTPGVPRTLPVGRIFSFIPWRRCFPNLYLRSFYQTLRS